MKIKIVFLPQGIRKWYVNLISPATEFFIKHGINPNFFTTVGLIVSAIATYALARGKLVLGGVLVLVAGTFDILDGSVARATNRVTKFGALYDSTMDRYGEVMIFFGLAYYFIFYHNDWIIAGINLPLLAALAVSLALGGAIMTSYVRARAEGLGLECKVGVMQRPERLVLLGFGAIIHKYALVVTLILIAILSNLTAIQRLYHVYRTEKGEKLTGGTKGES